MGTEIKVCSCNSKQDIEKEKILIHTIIAEERGFMFGEFFTINMRNRQITESPYVLLNDQGANSMVSLGSTVYVVGADKPDHIPCKIKPTNSLSNHKKGTYFSGMSFIDFSNLNPNPDEVDVDVEGGWKEAPCLKDDPSPHPAVATLGGKIYFFMRDDYGGIFDPATNSWETLLPPPEHGSFGLITRRSAVSDPYNNRLLLFFYDLECYFAYYPSDKRWERVLDHLPWSRNQVFIADGILYSYLPQEPNVFRAYDLATKQHLDITFTCKVRGRVWKCEFDEMLYLGNGYLCLATYSPDYTPSCKRTNVIIAKFRVQRTVDHPGELLVTPFPLETYTINAIWSLLATYLPI